MADPSSTPPDGARRKIPVHIPKLPFDAADGLMAAFHAFVWNADDAVSLRSTHGILGQWAGTLPSAQSQNIFLGLPLVLCLEEVVALWAEGIVEVFEEDGCHPMPGLAQLETQLGELVKEEARRLESVERLKDIWEGEVRGRKSKGARKGGGGKKRPTAKEAEGVAEALEDTAEKLDVSLEKETDAPGPADGFKSDEDIFFTASEGETDVFELAPESFDTLPPIPTPSSAPSKKRPDPPRLLHRTPSLSSTAPPPSISDTTSKTSVYHRLADIAHHRVSKSSTPSTTIPSTRSTATIPAGIRAASDPVRTPWYSRKAPEEEKWRRFLDGLGRAQKVKCLVFRAIWKGQWKREGEEGEGTRWRMMVGIRFGGDFLMYPGDPIQHHSTFILSTHLPEEPVPFLEMAAMARVARGTRKQKLLCTWDGPLELCDKEKMDQGKLVAVGFEWTGWK
ncbi:tRNA-splicing endonuclease subunit [Phlyctochytrium bullatum]|nr:tRNA-splicing endonuclease subunit [Phlyctochytrium bullatum]